MLFFYIHDNLNIPCLTVISVFAKDFDMPSDSHKIYIWQPYVFFHIYNHLGIPCLTDILLFYQSCLSLLKYYTHVHLYTMLMFMKC